MPLSGIRGGYDYKFSTIDQSQAVYDAFFEPVGKYMDDRIYFGGSGPEAADKEKNTLIVDLYGYKPLQELVEAAKSSEDKTGPVYVLSSRALPFKQLKSYGRQMRPVAANIVYETEGNDIHLYDMGQSAGEPGKEPEALRYLYEYRAISASRMIKILLYRIREKITGK